LIKKDFQISYQRPKNQNISTHKPESFEFDDLRLYLLRNPGNVLPPVVDIDGVIFELQIKTFLQHAWSIATHDLVYKSDSVSWAKKRIAAQVRAVLENAELSIGEAVTLQGSTLLNKSSAEYDHLNEIIHGLKERWQVGLPKKVSVLADNIAALLKMTNSQISDLWTVLDFDTSIGYGVKQSNLSPYSIIVSAFLRNRRAEFLGSLSDSKSKTCLFVPNEIDLETSFPENAIKKILRV
jgi:hypothetical protein